MAKNSFCHPCFPEEETIKEFAERGHGLKFEGQPSSTWWASMHQEQGGFADDKGAASAASNSHRQAEKRRRDRINAQLARLRKLIPKSDKMDKAALLERVVEQVRDLKRQASETSKFLTIPTEVDEVTIECHTNVPQGSPLTPGDHHHHHKKNKHNQTLIKVTFCCEDRPDLITELTRALKGLNLTTVGADIVCLGGRMKSILILNNEDIRAGDKEGVCNVSAIKESLMSVLNRIVSWSTSTPSFRVSSKRQRFFFSSY